MRELADVPISDDVFLVDVRANFGVAFDVRTLWCGKNGFLGSGGGVTGEILDFAGALAERQFMAGYKSRFLVFECLFAIGVAPSGLCWLRAAH